jgi:hypothetical protein
LSVGSSGTAAIMPDLPPLHSTVVALRAILTNPPRTPGALVPAAQPRAILDGTVRTVRKYQERA